MIVTPCRQGIVGWCTRDRHEGVGLPEYVVAPAHRMPEGFVVPDLEQHLAWQPRGGESGLDDGDNAHSTACTAWITVATCSVVIVGKSGSVKARWLNASAPGNCPTW